jgi:acyl-coenzyme A synthetase/AMP-(fatty) acid ligase
MRREAVGNVSELFFAAARRRGDAPALLAANGRCLWTFAGLAASAADLAAVLQRRGVQPGDRVLALAHDRHEAVRVAVAVLAAGATLMLPPTSLGLRQALRSVAAVRPRAVIASPAMWGTAVLEPWLLRVPIRVTLGLGDRFASHAESRSSEPVPAPVACTADTAALLSFTTGTTGHPKLIERSHPVLQAQHEELCRLRQPREGDVDFAGLSLLVLHNLASGVPSLLPPRGNPGSPGYGRRAAAAIRAGQVTTAAGFPSLFAALVREASPGDLRGLRAIQIGGALVRPALVRELVKMAPDAEITIVYGSTEAEPIAAIGAAEYLACEPALQEGHGVCVGQAIARVDIDPLGASGAGHNLTERCRTERQGRAVGLVRVSGPNVATADGAASLHPGDLGYLDHYGRLWLMGRASNAVPGALFPAEVEPVVAAALPWVAEAVLTTYPGTNGPRAVLAVEPACPLPGRAARERARAEIAALAAARGWPIAEIAILDRLPRDRRSGSKIDYPRLACLLAP